jgi:chemotaxis protein methyltransferase CheR
VTTTSTFAQVAAMIRRETAMVFDDGKEYLVDARLTPLAGALGMTLEEYVARLPVDPHERRRAIDALTINETSWFRDHAPYQAFTDHILPSVVAAKTPTGDRVLRVWSAACSSGQEAYSIAMLCEQHLPAGWDYEIVATDIATTMVERVAAGRYGQVEVNRGLPATQLVRWFQRDGRDWVVAQRLRDHVHARQMNLAAPYVGLGTFDVVLLRNVLIYFEAATRHDVLRRVRPVLATHGYLLLGSSETTLDLPPDLTATWRREAIGRVQTHRPIDAPDGATTDRSLACAR